MTSFLFLNKAQLSEASLFPLPSKCVVFFFLKDKLLLSDMMRRFGCDDSYYLDVTLDYRFKTLRNSGATQLEQHMKQLCTCCMHAQGRLPPCGDTLDIQQMGYRLNAMKSHNTYL